MRNYYALMDNKKVNLAAAYAVLGNNSDSVLFRTFEDIVNVTYRIRIAEELIKGEEDSMIKEGIVEEIEWYKEFIRRNIREKKNLYASIITAKYAKLNCFDEFYKNVINAIEREKEFDFYDWVNEINNIR